MSPTLLLASLLLAAAPAGPVPGGTPATGTATAAAAPTPPLAAEATFSPPAVKADPCDGAGSLPNDQACGDTPLCSARQRVKLACAVRDAMESRYVFWPVKSTLLAETTGATFDSRAHLDACVSTERAIDREEDPLRFYDRMRRCTAAFEDGHLLLGVPAALPQVALGLGLRLVDGKVYIANRERKLVSWLVAVSGVRDLEALLAVGNEVLEIDGAPVADRLAELARYVPASSLGARLERAVDALTRRDFAFPEKRTATLTLQVDGVRREVELPWWISPDAKAHVMMRPYLARTGLAPTDLLAWRYDQAKDLWDRDAGSAVGHLRTDTILPPRDVASLREYTDDADRVAVRFGEVVRRRDRAFCYLQILTFHTESLGGRDGKQPFPAVVEGFVKECKEKGLDLVLDLRQNGGGFLSHTNALAAALAPAAQPSAGGALVLRASTLNQLVYQQRAPALGGAAVARAKDDAHEPRRIAEAIGASRRAGEEFSPAFVEAPLRASAGVGGFDGKVVALVAPTCMSACDRLAAMLRASGRATLVGAPTEGAGGSQQEARNLSARWSDPEALLTLAIPNAAMGVARPGEGAGVRPAHAFFAALAFENRPVVPDVPYRTRLEDLTGHNQGWLAQVDAALFAPAPERVAAGPAAKAATRRGTSTGTGAR